MQSPFRPFLPFHTYKLYSLYASYREKRAALILDRNCSRAYTLLFLKTTVVKVSILTFDNKSFLLPEKKKWSQMRGQK